MAHVGICRSLSVSRCAAVPGTMPVVLLVGCASQLDLAHDTGSQASPFPKKIKAIHQRARHPAANQCPPNRRNNPLRKAHKQPPTPSHPSPSTPVTSTNKPIPPTCAMQTKLPNAQCLQRSISTYFHTASSENHRPEAQ